MHLHLMRMAIDHEHVCELIRARRLPIDVPFFGKAIGNR